MLALAILHFCISWFNCSNQILTEVGSRLLITEQVGFPFGNPGAVHLVLALVQKGQKLIVVEVVS